MVVFVAVKNQHTQLIIIFYIVQEKTVCSPAGVQRNYDTLLDTRAEIQGPPAGEEDIIGHCYYPVQIIYCDNYL